MLAIMMAALFGAPMYLLVETSALRLWAWIEKGLAWVTSFSTRAPTRPSVARKVGQHEMASRSLDRYRCHCLRASDKAFRIFGPDLQPRRGTIQPFWFNFPVFP